MPNDRPHMVAHMVSFGISLLLSIAVILACLSVMSLQDSQPEIVKWYEDGSGTLYLGNGTCTFPAFDSPEDKVICIKEGGS